MMFSMQKYRLNRTYQLGSRDFYDNKIYLGWRTISGNKQAYCPLQWTPSLISVIHDVHILLANTPRWFNLNNVLNHLQTHRWTVTSEMCHSDDSVNQEIKYLFYTFRQWFLSDNPRRISCVWPSSNEPTLSAPWNRLSAETRLSTATIRLSAALISRKISWSCLMGDAMYGYRPHLDYN